MWESLPHLRESIRDSWIAIKGKVIKREIQVMFFEIFDYKRKGLEGEWGVWVLKKF